ncbi:flagellar export chaperone FliS [Methylotenera mobilis]|uniref:Flagellar secretion chaperone FliS n=1 Tax=Methylotenera mobilis (strain JLW8 / ATCC BAA-1282 / DSM 17540) TaxID=583345 RepID=C6WV82_METML|nr:flagellar export chaperone FliS [Methylotenera mobilis]ACT47831.1 flagellar protein FliS [Methylotenera mobilis JLW8]
MFGLNQKGVNGYAKVGVETGVLAASPVKLIVMLYDGAISACHSAVASMQRMDIEQKGAMLSKAIMIIESGLRLSLDRKAGGEIAESLDALYAYMSSRLAAANVRNEPAPVQEVIKLLLDLKGAWEAIDSNKATAQVLNQAKGTQQGYTQQAKV